MISIVCSQCTYPNPAGASRCQQCGAVVSLNKNTVKDLVDMEKKIGLLGVPEQNNSQNDIFLCDETIPKRCEEWANILKAGGATKRLNNDKEAIQINQAKDFETQRLNYFNEEDYTLRAGTVHFRGDLILRHLNSDIEYIILNQALQREVILGRPDHKSGIRPTIDLTELEHHSNAISRRHAIINENQGLLLIIDQDSTNGTYLNGQHLVPYQPRLLRDKDVLWLGKVQLLVCFRCPKS